MADAATRTERSYSFGSFRLTPSRQQLLDDGKPVRLGSRALELLALLAERAGELVTKDELIARVWPDVFVDDGNVKVHVAALRKVLGQGQAGRQFIATVPGRGYRLVVPMEVSERVPPDASLQAPASHNLPFRLTQIVGRRQAIASVADQVSSARLVTIVGAGGIGKTTVALSAAHDLLPAFADGVRLLDLAPLSRPDLVPSALAALLGLEVRSTDPTPNILAFLATKRLLLVLDNCEHLVNATVALASAVLQASPGSHILATSREPLGADGERVHRLRPLDCPPSSRELSAERALRYPAVQLFVERASARLNDFALCDTDASLVGDICRRLDGIALAIEIAAGRIDAFGLRGLADLLADGVGIVSTGRRTGPPRQRTMGAVLGWSYDLLTDRERLVLRRLSVFAADFTLPAAVDVVGSEHRDETIETLADLVDKSFVAADVAGPAVRYRLLETTRAFSRQKLAEAGETGRSARRHASYIRTTLERAEAEWPTTPEQAWIAEYAPLVDDLRSALDWAYSSDGDQEMGAALTTAAVPLWLQFSLISECRTRVEEAIKRRPAGAEDRRLMQLFLALGWLQMFRNRSMRAVGSGWIAALEIAERLQEDDHQLRALWGIWAGCISTGEFRRSSELARRFHAVAEKSSRAGDCAVGERMIAASLHLLGDQREARKHIDRALETLVEPGNRSEIIRYRLDQTTTARITQARVLWLQGFADRALYAVHANIARAASLGHVLSLCNALAQSACPVTLLAGDLTSAERYVGMLETLTQKHELELWSEYARIYRGELLLRCGAVEKGALFIRQAAGRLIAAGFDQFRTSFLCSLAQSEIAYGDRNAARSAINDALRQAGSRGENWCSPELLRIKGEVLMLDGEASIEQARADFHASIELAAAQGALSWELRAALSLARNRQSLAGDAELKVLESLVARFSEGFQTADLSEAARLLKPAPNGAFTGRPKTGL